MRTWTDEATECECEVAGALRLGAETGAGAGAATVKMGRSEMIGSDEVSTTSSAKEGAKGVGVE